MPEETRIFDVAKPGRSSPDPTSKPVIVGHQPTMSDPMVREEGASSPIQVNVMDSSSEPQTIGGAAISGAEDSSSFFTTPSSESMLAHQDEPQPAAEAQAPPSFSSDSSAVFPTNEPEASPPDPQPSTDAPLPPSEHAPHVEGLHVGTGKRRSPLMKIALVLLVILVAAYLLIDSGVIKTSANLPFHIFKQKKPVPAATSNSSNKQTPASATAIPAGFTEYKIAGTSVTFAAPTVWGTPTSATDPGYSARGGTNKSDGTYAYIVDFATNKDVEVSVTSAKYLPVKRASLYYDFLQWCTGTNDGKFYETTMHFATSADKIDTPATTSCDQGPVDAAKIDTTTIVQSKAKSTDGKVIGDIYSKNLQNTDLPVFRVKDATSANAANIKQLLATVKAPQTSTSSTSSGQ